MSDGALQGRSKAEVRAEAGDEQFTAWRRGFGVRPPLGEPDDDPRYAALPPDARAFGSLRRGGRLVCVALPADDKLTVPIFDTVISGKSIIGSIVGTRKR